MEESTVAIIISVLALVVSFFTFFNNYVKPFKLLVFPSPRIGYPHMDWSEPGILLHLFFKNNGALPGIVTGLKVVFTSGEKSTEFFSFADIEDPESLAKHLKNTLDKSIFDGIYLDKFEIKSKHIYFLKRKDQEFNIGKTVATIYYKINGKKNFIKLPNTIEFYLTEQDLESGGGITFANFLPHEFVLHEDIEEIP